MHSQKNSEIRRDLTEIRCTLATQRPIYNTRKTALDRARGKIDASWPTRRRWAIGRQVDNQDKRMTALSQAAAASIALFQRYCRFEAVSLQSAVANSENELIARK